MDRAPVLSVRGLRKDFARRTGILGLPWRGRDDVVRAVDGVSFDVFPGEALGLVGESGSGKTTTGKLLVRLQDPTAGQILFEGTDIAPLGEHGLRTFRRQAQMIFQDPYESLNPRFTVLRLVDEPLVIHGLGRRAERTARALAVIETAGLKPARKFADRFPHELSGGQRQRVAIARALVLDPRFVVADEPTSMLDVSIKAGILRVLLEGLRERNLSLLYVSHDLSLVRYICERTAIMYLGRVVEMGETEAILREPLHPYARDLVAAIPPVDPEAQELPRRRTPARLDVAATWSGGCAYRARCPDAMGVCAEVDPALHPVGARRVVACHLFGSETVSASRAADQRE